MDITKILVNLWGGQMVNQFHESKIAYAMVIARDLYLVNTSLKTFTYVVKKNMHSMKH